MSTHPGVTDFSAGQVVPVADHHQHLFSPELAALLVASSGGLPVITAKDIVALIDSASIRRALVLSAAYMYGSPARTVEDEYARVQSENDWTGVQASQYPERLRAFCSFNPLKDYAVDELVRCASDPNLRHGIKLHFGNSDVQLDDPTHVKRLAKVFQSANDYRMAIVVHLRASISRNRPYGRTQARVFLEELLPLLADVPVQVAHLTGAGPGYDDPRAQEAMAVFAGAVENHDSRTRELWFDVATIADRNISAATAALVVKQVRQVGTERILYGSDAAVGGNLRPREGWSAFCQLPLREDEIKQIASNLAPYFRSSLNP
jgi:predicted TIM-barrel fold metal-dependent hydrolase